MLLKGVVGLHAILECLYTEIQWLMVKLIQGATSMYDLEVTVVFIINNHLGKDLNSFNTFLSFGWCNCIIIIITVTFVFILFKTNF